MYIKSTVHCSLYTVQCTTSYIKCTLYIINSKCILKALYTIQCTTCYIKCTLYTTYYIDTQLTTTESKQIFIIDVNNIPLR